jgi:hypothetical protein
MNEVEHRHWTIRRRITPTDVISGLSTDNLLFNSAQLASLISSEKSWSNPCLNIMTWLASIGLSQYSAQVSVT